MRKVPTDSTSSPSRSPRISRRALLAAGALLPLAGCGSSEGPDATEPASAPVPDVIGAQLYTVRRPMQQDTEGTLKALAGIGFKSVETGRADLPKVKPICNDLGMAVPAAHFEYACITGDWTHYGGNPPRPGYNLEAALTEAKEAGVEWFNIPYIPNPERTGADLYPRMAENFNKAGEEAAKMGIRVAYHHHAFEFEKFDGKPGFETLVEMMEPGKAFIEFDLYWASVAGEDPVLLLRKYPQHIKLLHLKDKKEGTPIMQGEGVPRDTFMELGKGVLDIPDALRAANQVGVEHYFIEQDETPGDPLESLRISFEYLQALKG
jgi:sugar phosphate isomerase/epimerase